MTLQDLKNVLNEALEAAYKDRDAVLTAGEREPILQNISLLQYLDTGVRKVMEKHERDERDKNLAR